MKSFFSTAITLFIFFGEFCIAQQANQNPYQLIHEKLLRTKTKASPENTLPFISGLISHGNKPPIGVFAKNLTAQELEKNCIFFRGDSLLGFDFDKNKLELFNRGFKLLSEFKVAMLRKQIAFIKNKYNLTVLSPYDAKHKMVDIGVTPSLNASICNNIDFEDGDLGGWTVTSGENQNSNSSLNVLGAGITSTDQSIYSCNDVNVITSAYGSDPLGIVGLDPNGGTTSIRLGGFAINTSDGYGFGCSGSYWNFLSYSNGEKIEKTITVSAANALLSYDYAVVLNDGGHGNGEQPYFHVYVTDLAGTVLSTCTEYYVQAPAGSPPIGFTNSGFVNTYDNSVLYYKNWTSNSINLTPFIGQSVKISFIAAGCVFGAHPGYAYVDAICGPLDIDATNNTPCAGTNVILTAPSVQGGSYSWSGIGVNGLTTQTVNATATGNYSCSIIPPQGVLCAYTVTRSVVFSPLPVANAGTTQSLTCINTSTVLNGSGGGNYSWTGPGILAGGASANPTVNVGGNYSLVITSTAGCVSSLATVSVVVNNTTGVPNVSSTGTITCLSNSVNLNSSTSGVTYTWVAPGGSSISGSPNTAAIIGNGSGTYSLNITDNTNGCVNSNFITVNTNTTLPVAIINTSPGLSCLNPTVNISGLPTSGVTYSWSGGTIIGAATNSTVAISSAAIYSLMVTNPVNGCSAAVPATVNIAGNFAVPTITTSNQTVNLICGVSSVSLSGNVNPAGSTYTWTSSGGGFASGVNNSTVAVTTATNYILIATDPVSGCTTSLTYTVIPDVNSPTVSLSSSNGTITCASTILSTTATSNPLSGVSYSWSGPGIVGSANSAIISGSLSGTYNLTVTNTSNNCSSSVAYVLSANNASINPNPTLTNTVNCANVTTTINSVPSPTAALYTYSWSTGATTNSIIVSPVATTNYTLIVTNPSNGCSTSTVVQVVANTATPTLVNSGVTNTISCLNPTVIIAPIITPSSNLTYVWSGPGIIGNLNNSYISVNQSGSYSLVITNTLTGCSNTAITIPIAGNSTPPTLNVSSSSSIGISCQFNTSTVTLMASSPGNISYNWSTGATSSNITTTIAGIYTVIALDNISGCSMSKTISVASNTTLPTFTASSSGNLPCGILGTTTLNATASNTNVSYSWTGPAINTGSNTAHPEVSAAGIYTVVVTDNSTGCSATKTLVVISSSVLAQFSPDVVNGFAPLTVNFNNQSTGAATYSWSFGNGTSFDISPTNIFNSSGTYTVVLQAMNGVCSSTAEVIIKVLQDVGFVPEVFTPNGDGKNDFFDIRGLDNYPNNSLQIFNRWGNEVYFAKPYKNDWDGTPNRAGKTGASKLPIGTYFYILDIGNPDKTIYRGFIELQY